MSALEELLDKEAIRDVLAAYAFALDFRDWDGVRRCFTPNGVYDMRDYFARLGLDIEPARGRDEMVRQLQGIDAAGSFQLQHFFTNTIIRVDGDRAESRCYLLVHTTNERTSFRTGAVWEDRLLRTAEGWQIDHRHLKFVWQDGSPEVVLGPIRASVPR